MQSKQNFNITHKSDSLNMLSMRQNQRGSTLYIFLLFVVTVLIAAGSAGYFGHWLGFRLGSDSLGETAKAYHKLKVEHKARVAEFEKMQSDLTLANQERDASLKNMDDIRQNLVDMKKREAFLIAQRDAYESMVVESGGIELKIYDQEIKPLPENAFEYRFDLVLLQPKNKPAKKINVDLTLLDGGAIVKVPLEKSSYEINGFKRIQGRFIMPKGFTPKKLKISVAGVGDQNVEQYYKWRYGKRIKKMPSGLIDVPPLETIDIS